ncbi:hypothetical protein [Actinopolymorpha pittospori]
MATESWITIGATLLSLIFLLGVAWYFSRRTLRITAVAIVLVTVILLVVLSSSMVTAPLEQRTSGLLQNVASWFWSPLYAGRRVPNSLPASLALLVLLALCYVGLEVVAARRESPRVTVADPVEHDNDETKQLLTDLKSSLPAVEVRAPRDMPGGSPGPSVAAVVEGSEVEGGKLVAAFLRLLSQLLPAAPSYVVRLRAENLPSPNRGHDGRVRASIDLTTSHTGQTTAAVTLPPLPIDEVAPRAAGFVASRVFQEDPSTPEWVKGKFDGEDLTAYLLSQRPLYSERTYREVRDNRLYRIKQLERAIVSRPAADIARYELACLYELEGRALEAVRLHALNRLHRTERSERARYRARLGMALSMLANEQFHNVWGRADGAQWIRRDILRYLREAGVYNWPNDNLQKRFVDPRPGEDLTELRRRILKIALEELEGYHKFARWRTRVWVFLTCRSMRSSLTPTIGLTRNGFRERSDRRARVKLAIQIVEVRLKRLDSTWKPTRSTRKTTRLDRYISRHRKETWLEHYNTACLQAATDVEDSTKSSHQRSEATERVVEELRWALDDPRCELYRPAEWLSMDPDLQSLRRQPGLGGKRVFDDFIVEQLRRDFDPPKVSLSAVGVPKNDKWLKNRIAEAWFGGSRAPRRVSLPRQHGASLRRRVRHLRVLRRG